MRTASELKHALERRLPWGAKAAPAPPPSAPSPMLEPRSPPGTARASLFFDAYPRFFETSDTSAYRGRLNLRYEAIFAENRDIFAGARVIDIASHDGRWSFAALQAGAAEVVGIEAREELVGAARENLERYGAGEGRYEFIAGDIFDVLGRQGEADVVLCLGYLYHTLRYNELMRRIRDTNPRYLIIDTKVIPRIRRSVVRVRLDRNERQGNAVADAYSHGEATLVGWPSCRALEVIVEAYGFRVDRYSDWGSLLRDNPGLKGLNDYADGRRVTALCVSVD